MLRDTKYNVKVEELPGLFSMLSSERLERIVELLRLEEDDYGAWRREGVTAQELMTAFTLTLGVPNLLFVFERDPNEEASWDEEFADRELFLRSVEELVRGAQA